MITIDYKPKKRLGQIITDSDTLCMIRNHFSIENSGKQFVKNPLKSRFISDRKYAITNTGLFSFGLYGEILKYLRDNQLTDISLTDDFRKRLKCGVSDFEFWDELFYDARYYQKDSVEAGLKKGCGVFLLATGAGKSLAQALLIENYKRIHHDKPLKCLIIVPGLGLVSQLKNDFDDYRCTFTYTTWNKTNEDFQDAEVIICNTELLNSRFNKNPWIIDVSLLVVDECHKINSEAQTTKIVSKIKTPNKFGFTGTLSDKPMDQWKTLGAFGPVIYTKKSKELRDEKYLSPVSVDVLQFIHPSTNFKYKRELTYIYSHDRRNKAIGRIAKSLKGNVLIMVNHLIHGESLLHIISNNSDKKVFFVNGEMEVSEREKIIDMMENGDNVICIAMASIFSTGINIKNLPNIMFAGLGKSFIRIVQSIGRGLRLHANKERLRIFDCCDNTTYSLQHSIARQEIYTLEEIPWKVKEINL